MKKSILLFTVILAVATLIGCEGRIVYDPPVPSVRYDVTGTVAAVNVAYVHPWFGVFLETPFALVPWTMEQEAGHGQALYLSATSCDPAGTVTVSIYVDEVLLASGTNAGDYVTATAYGAVP